MTGRADTVPPPEHSDLIRVEGKLCELVESVRWHGTMTGREHNAIASFGAIRAEKNRVFIKELNIGECAWRSLLVQG